MDLFDFEQQSERVFYSEWSFYIPVEPCITPQLC